MSRKRSSPARSPASLRQKTEGSAWIGRADAGQMTREEILRLVDELQIHHIELEMQNEELRQAHAELAHSRGRFSELYDFAPVGYATLNHDGSILEANLTLATMLGIGRSRLVGRKLTRFVTRDAQDAFHLHQRAIFQGGGKETCDLALRRADGGKFFARMESMSVRSPETSEPQCRSAIIDITRSREAEQALAHLNGTLEQQVAERTAELTQVNQALHESEEMLRQVTEGIDQVFWISDVAKNRMLYVSPSYARIWGRSCQSVIDSPRTWLDAIHPEDRRRIFKAAVTQQSSGEYDVEYRIRRPDGSERWIHDRAFPIRNAAGRVYRLAGVADDITERKRTQEALRESKERYHQLIQGLPAAVYTCRANGQIMLYNAAAVKLWGREPKIGRCRWCGSHQILTPEERRLPHASSPMALAVRHGEPIRGAELIVERPDGSRSHVLSFADPTYDRAGTVLGAVNMMVDITALKTAENALRTSERNLRKLSRVVEQSPTSVLITSQSGEIEYVNPTFTEVAGYTLQDVLGKNPRLLKSGEHPPGFYRNLWETIANGGDWRGELCNRKKNGELFWESAVIAPIQDEQGEVTHFVAIKEDITERRKAAAALHEREAHLRAILDTVDEAVVTIDRRGTITSLNPATERMFGYTAREMLGRNVSLLMPSPEREAHDGYLDRYHRTGRSRIIGLGREVRGRRKDGNLFPIDLAINEIKDMHLFIGVMRDITRRKELETEVLRIAEEERQRVAADLHDGICQELVGLLYLSTVLRRSLEKSRHPLVPEAKRIEQAIIGATDHTRQVARGMKPVVTDGSGLMHALQRLVETTARTNQIHCAFRCPTPVAIENPVVANELYRIAQEAVHNALRHGHASRINVRLSETGSGIRLSVTDNGRGLSADFDHGPGMGLRVMGYRAALIGGQLTLQLNRRGGTEVVCQIAKPAVKR